MKIVSIKNYLYKNENKYLMNINHIKYNDKTERKIDKLVTRIFIHKTNENVNFRCIEPRVISKSCVQKKCSVSK